MDRRHVLFAMIGAAALAGGAGAALADRDHGRDRDDDRRRRDHDEAYEALRSGAVMPLRDILPIVEAAYPGEIIEVEFEREDGIPVYEFTIVQTNGRYLEIYVDARTGEILEVEGD